MTTKTAAPQNCSKASPALELLSTQPLPHSRIYSAADSARRLRRRRNQNGILMAPNEHQSGKIASGRNSSFWQPIIFFLLSFRKKKFKLWIKVSKRTSGKLLLDPERKYRQLLRHGGFVIIIFFLCTEILKLNFVNEKTTLTLVDAYINNTVMGRQ